MRPPSVKIEKRCAICQKLFLVYPCYLKRSENSGVCCSNECRKRRLTKECQYCHALFDVRVSEARVKFCSKSCYYEGRKVTREHTLLRRRALASKRRAMKYNPTGEFDINYFKWLCEQFNHKCVMCGRQYDSSTLTIDHIVPLSKGGEHDSKNVQPLCRSCNRIKGNYWIFTIPLVGYLYNKYHAI